MTAPVAKGKTKSILDYYEDNFQKIIFVSPLRALAVEVYEKLKEQKNTYWLGNIENNGGTREEVCLNFLTKKKAILIATVEILSDEFLEMIANEETPILFVFDEFHLFYSWGESFRPILHDKFLGVLNTEHPVIGLSATVNENILQTLKNDLEFHHDYWVHLNYGNLELFRPPAKINFFGGHEKRVLDRAFRREIQKKNQEQVYLMFCSLRAEVESRMEWAERNGLKALGCVGGEVEKFQKELQQTEGKVDCIFSTVALSHGVNLPEISKVFINYEVSDYDFWLQMVGRGGRRGSPYEVYTFDKFHLDKKDQIVKYFSTGISDWIGIEI